MIMIIMLNSQGERLGRLAPPGAALAAEGAQRHINGVVSKKQIYVLYTYIHIHVYMSIYIYIYIMYMYMYMYMCVYVYMCKNI